MLKTQFALSFSQIGLIALAYQVTASLFQPWIGFYTDKHPLPWLLPGGMVLTLTGIGMLATAGSFPMLIVAACVVGLGSATFHPEASRVARMGSGGRFGTAQSIFQVGGNAGTAAGPLLAALVVLLPIVLLAVWQSCAFAIIIYLSGLPTIPAELYEAASLDGAGAWKQFTAITFPMIGAYFTINMVLSLKGFLQVFDHVVALTNGGPGTATESVTLLIFRGGFSGGEFAYQTANAVIFFIVITLVSLIQFRVMQSREADV